MSFREGDTPGGNVLAGIDCLIYQGNTQAAYTTDMNMSEDWQLEGIQTLGTHGFRDFMSLGYDLNFTLGTFLLRGADIAGNISLPGWQPDNTNNINAPSSGLYTFSAVDIHTQTTLFTVLGGKYGGGDLAVAVGSLMTRQTRWRGRKMLPGLAIS
jgi:hypothetical protein